VRHFERRKQSAEGTQNFSHVIFLALSDIKV
jgi:hypothetical protein